MTPFGPEQWRMSLGWLGQVGYACTGLADKTQEGVGGGFAEIDGIVGPVGEVIPLARIVHPTDVEGSGRRRSFYQLDMGFERWLQ